MQWRPKYNPNTVQGEQRISNTDLQCSTWLGIQWLTFSRTSYSSGSQPWIYVRMTWRAFKKIAMFTPHLVQVNQNLQGWGQASLVDSDVHQGEDHCPKDAYATQVLRCLLRYFSWGSNKSKSKTKQKHKHKHKQKQTTQKKPGFCWASHSFQSKLRPRR